MGSRKRRQVGLRKHSGLRNQGCIPARTVRSEFSANRRLTDLGKLTNEHSGIHLQEAACAAQLLSWVLTDLGNIQARSTMLQAGSWK